MAAGARGSQEEPGGSRESQGEPGRAQEKPRRSPGATKEETGGAREPGGARGSQDELPGARKSQEELGKARRSQREPRRGSPGGALLFGCITEDRMGLLINKGWASGLSTSGDCNVVQGKARKNQEEPGGARKKGSQEEPDAVQGKARGRAESPTEIETARGRPPSYCTVLGL